jgi:hypothetical protein
MKKITITFIGATLLSAASYATPQATVDISLLKSTKSVYTTSVMFI